MLSKITSCLIIVTGLFVSVSTVSAEDTSTVQELRVGTIERPPFAYKDGDNWTGFSIDLWEKIAEANGYEIEYQEFEVFADMIKNTQSGSVDLSAANISITLEREELMDFSQPIFDSWLAMMTVSGVKKDHAFFATLKDMRFYTAFAIVALLFTVFSLRRKIFSFKLKNKAFRYQNQIALILWGFFLIGYFNYILVTIGFEQAKPSESIVSYKDISNELVGVTIGSTSEKFTVKNNIPHRSYPVIEDVYSDLKSGEIDIMIHDLPVLEYYIKTTWNEYELVGNVFQKEKYGILMPENSNLKEDINRSLLEIKDSDTYEEILQKYF